MSDTAMLSHAVRDGTEMLKMHLADLSDADMLVRPVPAANHAAWQLSHVAGFAAKVAATINPATTLELPPIVAAAGHKDAVKSDDPAKFPTKAQLIAAIEASDKVILDALAAMSPADIQKPSPEWCRSFAPTMGLLVLLIPSHLGMHLGQIQVLRRKLGKPFVM